MDRWVVIAGGAVTSAVLLVSGERYWALGAACLGLYLAGRCGFRLDPQRLFSDEDRRTIWERAGGRCEQCGIPVHYEGDCPLGGCEADYQADHVIAWSRGGPTILENGACLCAFHNRVKSDR